MNKYTHILDSMGHVFYMGSIPRNYKRAQNESATERMRTEGVKRSTTEYENGACPRDL
jgi:hypothetical protein